MTTGKPLACIYNLCIHPNCACDVPQPKRKWDEGEHEGCGIDSQRATRREELLDAAILKFAREQGREIKLVYDKGSYEVTTPTWLAKEFARAIVSALTPADGGGK